MGSLHSDEASRGGSDPAHTSTGVQGIPTYDAHKSEGDTCHTHYCSFARVGEREKERENMRREKEINKWRKKDRESERQ